MHAREVEWRDAKMRPGKQLGKRSVWYGWCLGRG
jgi:hypothetical protein